MKNLILDTCQKAAMSFNNKLYEQIDGTNMSGSPAPVLANILMTVCEKVIVDKLKKLFCFMLDMLTIPCYWLRKKIICFKSA